MNKVHLRPNYPIDYAEAEDYAFAWKFFMLSGMRRTKDVTIMGANQWTR